MSLSDTKLYWLVSLDLRNGKLLNFTTREQKKGWKINIILILTVWRWLIIFIVIMWRNTCASFNSQDFSFWIEKSSFLQSYILFLSIDMNSGIIYKEEFFVEEIRRKADMFSFNMNVLSIKAGVECWVWWSSKEKQLKLIS